MWRTQKPIQLNVELSVKEIIYLHTNLYGLVSIYDYGKFNEGKYGWKMKEKFEIACS